MKKTIRAVLEKFAGMRKSRGRSTFNFKKAVYPALLFIFMMTLVLAAGAPAFAASDPGNYVFDISEGNITVASGSGSDLHVTYGASQTMTADFANTQSITIIGTSAANKVSVNLTASANLANIILNNAHIDFTTGDRCAFSIDSGTVDLTLSGTNALISTGGNPGLRVANANSVVIGGTGSLYATGGPSGAGIGGGNSNNGGIITINGGTIAATGGNGVGSGGGAGIGGGLFGNGGTVTINNGTVTATGGSRGAGIGGGNIGSGGTIAINGGTVTATGGFSAAGLGSGSGTGAAGDISISDSATVTAVSDGTKPAIDAIGNALHAGSTAYVLMANFSAAKSSGTTTGVYLKSDSSLKASFEPTISYKSIAFSLPDADTYQLKTSGILQQHDSSSTDFAITGTGLSIFGSVIDDADSLAVAADKAALTADDIIGANTDLSHITVALTNPLPSAGTNGAVITWSSNVPDVVSHDGQTVVRPAMDDGDAELTLTATITKGTVTDTKEFALTVLDIQPIFDIAGGYITVEAGTADDTLKVICGTEVMDNIPKAKQIIIMGESIANETIPGKKVTVNIPDQTANITLDNVDIEYYKYVDRTDCAFSIDGGTVNLTLIGANKIKTTGMCAGLRVASPSTLTIQGTGSLEATSVKAAGTLNYYASGIGGDYWSACGTIIIESGTVTARGGFGGAGIGNIGGKVTINDGIIMASGGSEGAGIGGGSNNRGGELTVNGGTVTAIGGNYGAGIGGGSYSSSGKVTINGGTVTAIGGFAAGDGGAGIGCGVYGSSEGNDISISDSATVTAVSSGTIPAIDATGGTLRSGSTAYVLMANFSATKSGGIATEVILKSDSSGQASYTPGASYKSIAFTLPQAAATYELITDSIRQQYGSGDDTDFSIAVAGLTTFNGVGDSDADALAVDKAALTADVIKKNNADLSNITGALALPTLGAHGSTISWVSNTPGVVSSDGLTVVRPPYDTGDAEVTLTATLTKGDFTDTKVFTLTVLESPNSTFNIADGNITVLAGTAAGTLKVTCGAQTEDNIPAAQEIVITGTSTGGIVRVDITGKTANIRLRDADIQLTAGDICAFSIDNGTVNLTLEGTNILKSTGGNAGLRVTDGKTLTIVGTGSLTATGAPNAAGIGGGNWASGGTITIQSGTVTAIGGSNGSGIGGGANAGSGAISISDAATVVAVSTGVRPAIDATGGALQFGSSAYVLMANFASERMGDVTTAVYKKSDGELLASFTPATVYKSIAFTVPTADTYQLKTADMLQMYDNDFDRDFEVEGTGLTVFDTVAEYIPLSCTVKVVKDAADWTEGTPEITLSVANDSLTDAVTGTCTDGVYTFTGLDRSKTYYVWDTSDAPNNQYTELSLSNSNAEVTVNYYSVTLTAGAGIDSTSGSGAYLSGSEVQLGATVADDYTWCRWKQVVDGVLVSGTQNYTIPELSAAQSYTALATPQREAGAFWTDAGNYDSTLYDKLTKSDCTGETIYISTPQQLAAVARAQDVDGIDFSGVTFELTQNIDLSGRLWNPIGLAEGDTLFGAADGYEHSFNGNFDGKNYVISNMDIEDSYISAGLFGDINAGTIVTIENVTVNGSIDVTNTYSIGGVVGYGQGLVLTNCINHTAITATGDGIVAGGILGYGMGVVLEGCVNETGADISITTTLTNAESTVGAGGIAGILFPGSVYNSANFASVTASVTSEQMVVSGGILGLAIVGTVHNCYNTGAGHGGWNRLRRGGNLRL